jgi:hypothetical protein
MQRPDAAAVVGQEVVNKPPLARALAPELGGLDPRLYGGPTEGLEQRSSLKALLGTYPTAYIPPGTPGTATMAVHDVWV